MLAWRAFKVESRGLCSLYRQYVFARENVATCIPDSIENFHPDGVPLATCTCGFWALNNVQEVLSRFTSTPRDNPSEAIGLVSGFGRFVEHDDNVYRFERMSIIAIGAVPHWTASMFSTPAHRVEQEEERLHWLAEAGRTLGIPLHYDRSLEHVLGELAIEAGRYLAS